MSTPRFTLGIDLGTTHTAVAFTRLDDRAVDGVELHAFALPQTVAPHVVEERVLLPSVAVVPTDAERSAKVHALPFADDPVPAVGAYARSLAPDAPGRVVTSAKSWLSHPDHDPRAAYLPLEADAGGPHLSPFDASRAFLGHVRDAWNEAFPSAPFEEQEITVTVPASFDPRARELTAEAARAVGAQRLSLLEEPQAALYAYLADHARTFREELGEGDVVLVVDVGGGTTDFSLIAMTSEDGRLAPVRVAVGDHILLGGDNMDLAVAALAERKLAADGHTLDAFQRRGLASAAQGAKEALLGGAAEVPVVLAGRGTRLVGGSLRTSLGAAEVVPMLLDGFFPSVGIGDGPTKRSRGALRTRGLPYADEPAITRHLVDFLARHAGALAELPGFASRGGEGFVKPTALLLNGGVFRAEPFAVRVAEVLDAALAKVGAKPVRRLGGNDLDQAVARGAAYHAFVKHRGGLRIRGGLPMSYYVGIETAAPAIPGLPPEVHALCVAPLGLEEGTPAARVPMELGLVVGEPVRLRFFTSSVRRNDEVGALLERFTPAELVELGEIEMVLPAEGRKQGEVVPVQLESRLDDAGTLELSVCATRSTERWRVSLDVRTDRGLGERVSLV